MKGRKNVRKDEGMGEMGDHIVLVFDIGTQSSRALLIDSRGEIIGIVKKAHTPAYESDRADWAEQDADFYYRYICEEARELRAEYPKEWERVEAVSLTTIRDTVVCLDDKMRPLRRAILWLDKRRTRRYPRLSPFSRLSFRAVGMERTVRMQYRKSHCNWIREEEPEIWEKTDKFVLLGAYLTYRMTGRLTDSVDSMVGHIPFEHRRRQWMSERHLTRVVFPMPQSKLCELTESGEMAGRITAEFARDSGVREGLPMIATGSDKACEVLGMGCVSRDQAAIGLGTTATITFNSDRYVEPEPFIPPYASVVKGCFNPEVEIFRGYWLISWFKKEFAAHEVVEAKKLGLSAETLLNRHLASVPPGCEGLLFQPYFTPNVTMPSARGAVIGFSDRHTRLHLYRAIIEGINYALIDGMKAMEKRSGHRFREIHLAGGGSQSDEICQITANMFGLPVIRGQSYEAAGLGSAMVSLVGLGVFSDYEEAIGAMVRERDRFLPDPKIHEIYRELYRSVYKEIYKNLASLYDRLQEIYHRAEYGVGRKK